MLAAVPFTFLRLPDSYMETEIKMHKTIIVFGQLSRGKLI
jgi:hypothetical protein